MKKSLLFLLTIVTIAMFASCGGDKKSKSSKHSDKSSESVESSDVDDSEDADDEFVEGVKYENDDFEYSVVLPEGFEPQNDDAEMEKERGGKLFLADGGFMIDVTAKEMNYIGDMTPEASIDQSIEMTKALDEGADIKKIDAISYLSKSQDNFGLRAHYELQKNGKKFMIDFTYPEDKKDQFDEDIESIINSFNAR